MRGPSFFWFSIRHFSLWWIYVMSYFILRFMYVSIIRNRTSVTIESNIFFDLFMSNIFLSVLILLSPWRDTFGVLFPHADLTFSNSCLYFRHFFSVIPLSSISTWNYPRNACISWHLYSMSNELHDTFVRDSFHFHTNTLNCWCDND